MTTLSRPGRLIRILVRFGNLLHRDVWATPPSGTTLPFSLSPSAQRQQDGDSLALVSGIAVAPPEVETQAGRLGVMSDMHVADRNRRTTDSDEYGNATLVSRMRPPSADNVAYPLPASHRELWGFSSSVDPEPVWYRVAGYKDQHQRPLK